MNPTETPEDRCDHCGRPVIHDEEGHWIDTDGNAWCWHKLAAHTHAG